MSAHSEEALIEEVGGITRRIIAEDPKWTLSTVPLLTELMLKRIVQDFKKFPHLNDLPNAKQKKIVLKSLPVTLPLHITTNLIDDEDYWKRSCRDRWPLILPNFERKETWKQVFFENHFKSIVEFYLPSTNTNSIDEGERRINVERPKNMSDIIGLAKLAKDYIFKLNIEQLLPNANNEINNEHISFDELLPHLENLEELSLTYQVKNCGMNFEWGLFDFTENDCTKLAKGILSSKANLTRIALTKSYLKCDLTRTFCAYMLKNDTLKELNLSRNEIGDRGARGVAKLAFTLPNLKSLKLGDNSIGNDGCKAIAAALSRDTCKLEELHLNSNAFNDEASSVLFMSLARNTILKKLNLAANQVGEISIQAFGQICTSACVLKWLNLSGNEFGVQVGRILQEGLEMNKSLEYIDIRLTGTGAENEYTIQNIVDTNRKNKRAGN